jgi:hypothetical protein
VPGPAGTGRSRTGPGQPHRPDPAVHPPRLITCHPANCNAIRARPARPHRRLRRAGCSNAGSRTWSAPGAQVPPCAGRRPRGGYRDLLRDDVLTGLTP